MIQPKASMFKFKYKFVLMSNLYGNWSRTQASPYTGMSQSILQVL